MFRVGILGTTETTVRFYQEIFNEKGVLVEIHEKHPVDKGQRKVSGGGK
ncbi:MAG: hypothetical protein HY897_22700 [Deltaproteobacteria bacterium]|nr:hypothetical protein [Deltaproteobacteria bacterium]